MSDRSTRLLLRRRSFLREIAAAGAKNKINGKTQQVSSHAASVPVDAVPKLAEAEVGKFTHAVIVEQFSVWN